MAFKDTSLGEIWLENIQYASFLLNFVKPRFEELTATKAKSPIPSAFAAVTAAINNLLADLFPFVADIGGLKGLFAVGRDEDALAEIEYAIELLNDVKTGIEALPDIYFDNPNPPPTEPTTDPECQQLIKALERLKPGANLDQIRQIVREETSTILSHVTQNTNYIRTELVEPRWKVAQIWAAVHTADSTREQPVATLDKHFALWEFPKILPKSIIEKRDGLGNKIPMQTVNIRNWLELIEWQFRVFEELIGEFPTGIEIILDKSQEPVLDDDGNPTGSTVEKIEKKTVYFDNLSEILTETFLLSKQIYENSEQAEQAQTKQLIDLSTNKKIGIQNSYKLQSIIDYLGFGEKHKTVDVPFLVDVRQKKRKDFNKPVTLKVDVVEFDGKNGLQDSVAYLRKAAGVILNKWFRGVPSGQATAGFIKNLITKDKEFKDSLEENDLQDLDVELEKIEQGFIGEAGASETINPYGRPYGSRPRVRRIGQQTNEENQGG